MVEQPQKDKQEVKHGPGWCKLCQQQIPKGEYKDWRVAIGKHKWAVHEAEMLAQSHKGTEASAEKHKKKADAAVAEKLKTEQEKQVKATPPSDPGDDSKGNGHKKDGLKAGDQNGLLLTVVRKNQMESTEPPS